MPKLRVYSPTDLDKKLGDDRSDEVAALNPELAVLPERRRKLILLLMRDPTLPFAEAMRQVGYSTKSHSAVKIAKRAIQGALSQTFKEAGVFEMDIVRVLKRNLDAKRYIPIRTEHYKDGKIEKKTVDLIPIDDGRVQIATAKLMAQLGGMFASTKLEVSGKITHERIFSEIDPEVLEQRIRELEAKGVRADFEVLENDI